MTTLQCNYYMIIEATINIYHILKKVIRYKTGYSPSTFTVCYIRKRIVIRFVAWDIKDLTFSEMCFCEKYDVELLYPSDDVVVFEECPTAINVPITYVKNNIICTRSCL